MSALVRGATVAEYPAIREILVRAFETRDEADLWDYLVNHDPGLHPERVRLAVIDGRPVACTVVLPREIRGRLGWVSGAVITLVACLPEMQGHGYAGMTIRSALGYMAEKGWALGILYGHPNYYPRFGFVPVLPFCDTTLTVTTSAGSDSGTRSLVDDDLPLLARLYNDQLGGYPCAVARDASSWLWQTRNQEHSHVLILTSGQGYALVSRLEAASELFVREAAATNTAHLLDAIEAHAGQGGFIRVRLALPPRHPLTLAAIERGAEQTIHPPSAGMVTIVDAAPLLPPGYWLDEGDLMHGVRRIGRVNPLELIPYIVGLTGLDGDPGGWPIDDLSPDVDPERLAADWPTLFPHWSLDPFWS